MLSPAQILSKLEPEEPITGSKAQEPSYIYEPNTLEEVLLHLPLAVELESSIFS